MPRIFLSAGEPSGVAIAATLMRTLRRRLGDDVAFTGLGGPAMVEQGLQVIYDPARTAAMWLWGNLKRIPAHRRALHACIDDWKRDRPDVVVTVDYQAFHLYLGTSARALGIPVVHFVGSQFWARRYYTLEPIRRAYSHVMLIHEFEKQHYDRAGIPATFVGHPLFERLAGHELDAARLERMRHRTAPRVGLLPGSRKPEIAGSLPVMLDAARALRPIPDLLVSAGRPESEAFIERSLDAADVPGEVYRYSSGEILTASDVALITSGSASMEAVFYGCPAVVVYRLSLASYFFARPHITCHIAQPNLIAGREIVPEFLLGRRDAREVSRAVKRLLENEEEREAQRAAFAQIRARLLAGPAPSEAAADVVFSFLN
jgi:lipid-A-disaccharide synthase